MLENTICWRSERFEEVGFRIGERNARAVEPMFGLG